MTSTIELPLWVLVLVLGFAAIAALDRVLVPSVRWFFRRRMERAVAELNKRLERPIRPFKLMRRPDMIVRLIYDPQVMEAVVEYAHAEGVPESVAFQRARSYAREIVPAFSAAAYFGFAIKLARSLSRGLYKVRLGPAAGDAVIDKKATVVFVMNHRSNMDYVLVTWLAAERSALAYAVGEWARVWPLQSLIRAMGAYFIRRRYQSPLYRRVLARYVQMATHEGVTQAIFPEGGLSLDGRVAAAKTGLLRYIAGGHAPEDGRDVVFVPVALNYDRVLEDRVLLEAAATRQRRFPVRYRAIAGFILRHLWKRMRGQFHQFGYAAVSYGEPLSLAAFRHERPDTTTEDLAAALMERIRNAVPVLPVPLVANALLRAGRAVTAAEVEAQLARWAVGLRARGTHLHLPGGEAERSAREGLEALARRRVIAETASGWVVCAGQEPLLQFYAASIEHLLEEASEPAAETSPPRLRRPGETSPT